MLSKKHLSLFLWIVSIVSTSFFIGRITQNKINRWYEFLNQSLVTPPNYWFGIVWTILYIMIAISGWIIWHKKKSDEIKTIKVAYIIQIILNFSWIPLFFHYQLICGSFLCIIALIFVVTFLIVKTFKQVRIVSILFVPYLLWLLFAAYLNFYICKNN